MCNYNKVFKKINLRKKSFSPSSWSMRAGLSTLKTLRFISVMKHKEHIVLWNKIFYCCQEEKRRSTTRPCDSGEQSSPSWVSGDESLCETHCDWCVCDSKPVTCPAAWSLHQQVCGVNSKTTENMLNQCFLLSLSIIYLCLWSLTHSESMFRMLSLSVNVCK